MPFISLSAFHVVVWIGRNVFKNDPCQHFINFNFPLSQTSIRAFSLLSVLLGNKN